MNKCEIKKSVKARKNVQASKKQEGESLPDTQNMLDKESNSGNPFSQKTSRSQRFSMKAHRRSNISKGGINRGVRGRKI